MIQDLEEIMIGQLKHYKKVNGTLPKKLLYYRDGVSEGQFSQVSTHDYHFCSYVQWNDIHIRSMFLFLLLLN